MPEEIKTCPEICKDIGAFVKGKIKKDGNKLDPHAKPYEPGNIEPPIPKAPHPKDAPPAFLPQPHEPVEDDMGMGPTGPWATGNIDWTPLAGMTGTRPVVDKYSITRYSLGEWRKHNEEILNPGPVMDSNISEYNAKTCMMQVFGTIDKEQSENTRRLKQRAQDVFRWKLEVEHAINAISEEIVLLEEQRQRLKGASSVLMLPEAISGECIELRSNRFEPDLVRDQAEIELIKEMSLVGEIRKVFTKTLMDIEEQMTVNKAAKARIEFDWSDKTVAYNTETLNISLNNKSTTILFRPGATRFGDNSSTIEYWEHFCRENIKECEAVRQKSADLRGSLDAILVNAGRDLRNQADRTDMALAETVALTEELTTKLEQTLKMVLQRTADIETLISELQDAVRKMDVAMKLAQTRLDNRNYGRPNVENCRDVPQYGLIDEVKKIAEGVTALKGQIRNAQSIRNDLIKKRGDLEKEIAVKRKSLNIDRDRCGMDANIPAHTAINDIVNENIKKYTEDRPISPYDYSLPDILPQPVPKSTDKPPYLPQGSDNVTLDFMKMNSIGPWACSNIDYRPSANLVGVRPIVDKYSITRYSVPEWRIRNAQILKGDIIPETNKNTSISQNCLEQVKAVANKDYADNTRQLQHRTRHIFFWKSEIEDAINNITNEISNLEEQRQRLKSAMANIMLPDSIARENLLLRGHRMEPDLVQDEPQEKLITEASLIAEIQRLYEILLQDVEKQQKKNVAAKERIEYDWSNKKIVYNTENMNVDLNHKATNVRATPGVTRLEEGQSDVNSWENFSKKSILLVEKAIQESMMLRAKLDAILINAARDMRSLNNEVTSKLAERISCTDHLRMKLENQLQMILDKIVETENIMDKMNEEILVLNQQLQVAQTRLHNKTWFGRPNGENCREGSLIGLIEEVKNLNDSISLMKNRLSISSDVRLKLLMERANLEKEICVKRKSLQIDRDRCLLVSSHFPSATKLCGH